MALKLNLNRIKGDMDSLKNTGFQDVPAGRGMVTVKEFSEFTFTKAKNPGHELKLEIVAWTNPEGVAQEHKEIIFVDDGSRDEDMCSAKLMKIAIACGLITPAQAEAARNGEGELELDLPSALPGRPMFVEIVKRKDKDGQKEYTNVGEGGFAYYHLKDPRCAAWPKHSMLFNQSLALVGEWEPLKKDAKDAAAAKPKSTASANPFAGKL